MSRSAFHRLRRRGTAPADGVVIYIVGCLAAVMIPVMILLLGLALELLVQSRGDQFSSHMYMGAWLRIPIGWLGGAEAPLRSLGILILIGVGVAALEAVLLSFYLSSVLSQSIKTVTAIYHELFAKSHQLAVARSVSGQQIILREVIGIHLPRLRAGFVRWEKTVPRHVVQAFLCLLLSFLIHPWLTLLTAICAALVGQAYWWQERRSRLRKPVLRERVAHHQQRIQELCETGPLLSSVHPGLGTEEVLKTELRAYSEQERQLAMGIMWKTPVLILATAVVLAIVCFIVGLQIIDTGVDFTVAAAITLCISQIAAANSFLRWQRLVRAQPAVDSAAKAIEDYLAIQAPSSGSKELKSIGPIQNEVVIDHVTLHDSSGRRLLEDASATLHPKHVIAIVGSDDLQARALAELLLGFGRPVSGRMLLDTNQLMDISPDSIAKQCVWVGPDGPLIAGTVEENLRSDGQRVESAKLTDAVRLLNAYDAIQNLPDGFATMVAPHDDRLDGDELFRLGLARALLRNASIIVAEEPSTPALDSSTEEETTLALKQLANLGRMVVVLPHRISTLRNADQVLLVHQQSIIESGTHADLIQRSHLYRHLTYVRYNPMRNLS